MPKLGISWEGSIANEDSYSKFLNYFQIHSSYFMEILCKDPSTPLTVAKGSKAITRPTDIK